MTIIQRPKRITTENISTDEAKEAVENVAFATNTYIEESYSAIMGGINVKDNLDQEYIDITLNVDGSGIPNRTTRFQINLNSRIMGVSVENVSGATLAAAPFVTWQANQGSNLIKITQAFGFTADTDYTVRLLVKGS